jgi:hypothetical protein
MKDRIIIVSEEHRKRALTILEHLPLAPVHEVVIREHVKDRSAEQNALYWKWLTVIGNELGESKEDLHERYKDKFLVNIYERDNPDYAEMIQSLRNVWRNDMKAEAVNLRKKIVALTSTTTATVKQMTEYMTCIEHDAAGLAIRLPQPELQ